MDVTKRKKIMTAGEVRRTLERLAFELIERHDPSCGLALVGIQRRGAELATRLKTLIDARARCDVPLGKLDINLYRDDWTNREVQPQVGPSDIPFSLAEKDVVLVDDVLFSGRTIRAALEALLDYGRPRRVELLVLVDRRGHRELPIQADYVGKRVHTETGEHVDVAVAELDGEDAVHLVE
ncbi:bifunctional pyr operon transcriptional regulator/uracil phosphoribosyltransferase PyrR [Solidesulfovibrio sp.]|uniref:bifunctional pyr operon transcriptional regulator/uracil phosphoribosyltransferase PyrR n=1 Tax=Solidesulfovibrio sp. TaxID=2910990 RepID=UPI002B1F7A9D|nr:bifunctional pyr operon transcriptional regulator/uracil phosphoribosyltransferase PyrR [Solidesulfovibrio sp.]MEA4855523.1 bifunctional pyr operon transcriptional regulator/uracil phosphoribosyltransferase PyrR [Solidesulfovibrio sp.]